MSVLELAQTLGDGSEACRQRGMSLTQFYEYKRPVETVNAYLATIRQEG